MKVKTSELTGFQLDLAVAKTEGEQAELNHGEVVTRKTIGYQEYRLVWQPSTDWAQGGTIIGRERIGVEPHPNSELWISFCNGVSYVGPTPLIAAMRCYVASKLGDEIELPEELN